MLRKLLIGASIFVFSFVVLLISVFRTASVKYEFNSKGMPDKVLGETSVKIDYDLAYSGRVLPDSPFWPVKALRDRIWLLVTTNPSRKAELKLLFADKRLGGAKILFEKGKPEEGLTTLTKAEKYLEEASRQEEENRKDGLNTLEFSQRLSKASLRHYEVMEGILSIAPEEAKPGIIQSEDYAKRAYEKARNAILEKGGVVTENPFGW